MNTQYNFILNLGQSEDDISKVVRGLERGNNTLFANSDTSTLLLESNFATGMGMAKYPVLCPAKLSPQRQVATLLRFFIQFHRK